MPNRTKLGWAKGIKEGIDSFLRSYYMATQYEDEQKRNKNAPVLQLIMSQLDNPDVPFSQHQALIDRIPELIGIKLSTPLSQQLNLPQLNQALIDTGTNEDRVTSDPNKDKGMLIDESGPQVLDSGIAPDLVQRGLGERKFLKRGDVSPNDLKRFQKNIGDERDFQQAVKLEETKLSLKAQSDREELKAKGWQKTGDIFYDKDKELYFEQWTNPFSGETKRIEFPKNAVPKSTVEKSITVGGLPTKAKLLTWAYNVKSQQEDNPSSVSSAQVKAADDIIKDEGLGQKSKDAYITATGQGISGDKPIQPTQQETFSRQDDDKIIEAEEKANENDDLVTNLQIQAANYLPRLNDINLKMGEIRARNDNKEPTLEDEPEDYKEYQNLQKQLDSLNDEVRGINKQITEAQAKSSAAKKTIQKRSSQKFTKTSTNNNLKLDPTTPNNQKAIRAFRDANNGASELSDIQILEIYAKKRGNR